MTDPIAPDALREAAWRVHLKTKRNHRQARRSSFDAGWASRDAEVVARWEQVDRLQDRIARALAMHPRGEFFASGGMVWFGRTEFPDQCTRCRDDWPCPDVRALTGTDQ